MDKTDMKPPRRVPQLDRDTVKLHVADDGNVWYLVGNGNPVAARSLAEVCDSHVISAGTVVKMLGTPGNAAAIVELFQNKIEVRVATPAVLMSQRSHGAGRAAVTAMRMLPNGFPSSLGGWRIVTEFDAVPYRLAAAMQEGAADAILAGIVSRWSLMPALSFCSHLSLPALARVVGTVRDPRWYTSLSDGGKISRLRAYLGLCPRVAIHDKYDDVHRQRYLWMRDTWHAIRPRSLNEPGCFLWQQYVTSDSDSRELRVTQRLLTFIRYLWLDAAYRESAACHDPLFDPTQFFRNPAHVDAFCAHLKVTTRSVRDGEKH